MIAKKYGVLLLVFVLLFAGFSTISFAAAGKQAFPGNFLSALINHGKSSGIVCSFFTFITGYQIASETPSWTAQNSSTTNNLGSEYFIDANTGWAVGNFGLVLKTVDGGATWSNLANSGVINPRGIYFSDNSKGVVIGTSKSGGTGVISRTTDGGKTWTSISAPSIAANPLYALYFVDANTGWTALAYGTFLKTTDGGATWTSKPSGVQTTLNSIYFIDANTGWTVGGPTGNTVGSPATILKTIDAGKTWQPQKINLVWAPPDKVTSMMLSDVYFVNANTGWAVGNFGTILKTTDGGATWNSQTSGTSAYLNSVRFIDENIGWVVGSGGTILKTADSGKTWAAQASNTSNHLQDLYFVNANTGWVVGDRGTILKYSGGAPKAEAPKELVKDTTSPVIKITYPQSLVKDRPVVFTVTATDDVQLSSLQLYGVYAPADYKFENSTCTSLPAQSATCTYTAICGKGTTVFSGAAQDSSGNKASYTPYIYLKCLPSLTVSRGGSGSGTVTSSPLGIDCDLVNKDCNENYASGTKVTLTATVVGGGTFTGWAGDCAAAGASPTCDILIDDTAKAVTANFGSGKDAIPPTGNVSHDPAKPIIGQTATITANAADNVQVSTAYVYAKSSKGMPLFEKNCTINAKEGTCKLITGTLETVGDYFMYGATIVDSSGNSLVLKYPYAGSFIVIETTKPVITDISHSPLKPVLGEIITFNASASDNVKVYSIKIFIDSALNKTCYINAQSGFCTSATNSLLQGTHTYYAIAADSSGNEVTSDTKSVDIGVANYRKLTVTKEKIGTGSGTIKSIDTGIVCGGTCSKDYLTGTQVTLIATPDSGSKFVSWTGCTSATETTCNINIDSDKTITALFSSDLNPPTVKIVTIPDNPTFNQDITFTATAEDDTAVSSIAIYYKDVARMPGPTATKCTGLGTKSAICNYPFSIGSPAAGYGGTHTYYAIAKDTSNNEARDPATGSKNFTLSTTGIVYHSLIISKQGDGSGIVASSGNEINCGSKCVWSFLKGSTITLTAAPDSGSTFMGWVGCAPSAKDPQICTVYMDNGRGVVANFAKGKVIDTEPPKVSVTYTPDPLPVGQKPTMFVVVTDNIGVASVKLYINDYEAQGIMCTDIGKTSTSCKYLGSSMTGTNTFYAVATDIAGNSARDPVSGTKSVVIGTAMYHPLIIGKTGTGKGTVTADTNHPGIDCGTKCSASILKGDTVTLKATPDSSSTFENWSSNCIPSPKDSSVCTVMMDNGKTVSANFALSGGGGNIRTLTLIKLGKNLGAVTSTPTGIDCGDTCSFNFDTNTQVTLTATPSEGASFAGWGIACSGTETTCTVIIDTQKSVKATFTSTPACDLSNIKLTFFPDKTRQGMAKVKIHGLKNCGGKILNIKAISKETAEE